MCTFILYSHPNMEYSQTIVTFAISISYINIVITYVTMCTFMTKMTHSTNLNVVVKKLIWTVVASIVITIWLEWTIFFSSVCLFF
jgi:RsiW-degrading membrane proteinase PrsW (M82 family)